MEPLWWTGVVVRPAGGAGSMPAGLHRSRPQLGLATAACRGWLDSDVDLDINSDVDLDIDSYVD